MPDAPSLDLEVVKPITRDPGGPVVFSIMRDEDYFLPFFLDHYRRLGVGLFLIYDDGSSGFTPEYLAAQPDCAVVKSRHRFGDIFGEDSAGRPRKFHQVVKVQAPDFFFPDRWVLTADADEFLILSSAFSTFREFTDHLDGMGRLYATAPMVDFYGHTLADRNYDPGLDPFAANPYFDAGPYYYWTGARFPVVFSSGVRGRLFRMLCAEAPDRLDDIFKGEQPTTPSCWKIPLLRRGRGIGRIGDHEINLSPHPGYSPALAHFKFYPGLDAKIEGALKERQYYAGSVEYAVLAAAIELFGERDLVSAETRTFDGPRSLEDAGLIAFPAGLEGLP